MSNIPFFKKVLTYDLKKVPNHQILLFITAMQAYFIFQLAIRQIAP